MQAAKMMVSIGIVLLAAGCLPALSLHPLFTEKDLVFEPALLGTWASEDDEETLDFQQSGDNAYKLVYMENGVPANFQARVVQIGDYLFLDVFPGKLEKSAFKNINEGYFAHMVPGHTFWKIQMEHDVLHLAMLEHAWINRMIHDAKVEIAHVQLDEHSIVLTAKTEDLQQLLLTHAQNSEAFTSSKWRRTR